MVWRRYNYDEEAEEWEEDEIDFYSTSWEEKYDDDVRGARSDGYHTTVYNEGSHRSWDSDSQGNRSDDHSTDHKTGKITDH